MWGKEVHNEVLNPEKACAFEYPLYAWLGSVAETEGSASISDRELTGVVRYTNGDAQNSFICYDMPHTISTVTQCLYIYKTTGIGLVIGTASYAWR